MKYRHELINIRECLVKYIILKRKIQYYSLDDKKINNFVSYVDESLNIFKEHEKQFILNVYVNRKNYLEINYSKSSFYYLKNKLDAVLIEIFKNIY